MFTQKFMQEIERSFEAQLNPSWREENRGGDCPFQMQ